MCQAMCTRLTLNNLFTLLYILFHNYMHSTHINYYLRNNNNINEGIYLGVCEKNQQALVT